MTKIAFNASKIDFIGDIHGHADKLEKLLKKMGYVLRNGCYRHPERKVLFVGDYIDRGPKIRETLHIVRCMTENDQAVALMGNHEYNAICFHYPEYQGGHLRKHSIKNILQHHETILQFKNDQQAYNDMLDWFKTLPLYFETEFFRAVHACWDRNQISYLRSRLSNDRFTDKLIVESAKKGTKLYDVIDETLKGKEAALPKGQAFSDKDGFTRSKVRIRWWEEPRKTKAKDLLMPISGFSPASGLKLHVKKSWVYSPEEKPVFFGHYWLRGKPKLFRGNICCLDYSVAKKGYLGAYRFNGEQELSDRNWYHV